MIIEPLKQIDNNNNANFESILNIRNIQYYFPPLTLYGYIKNNSNERHRKKILTKHSIHKMITEDTALIYSQNKYKNTYDTKQIFVKANPILEPLSYIMENYSKLNTPYLPFIYDKKTIDKVNNINNSCYIDAFFSILSSKLVEKKKCPSFPLFYDTISCISDKFRYDISDEYEMIKYESWFLNNINKTFRVISNDSVLKYSIKKTTSFKNIGLSSHDNFNDTTEDIENLNVEELDIDELDIEELDIEELDIEELDINSEQNSDNESNDDEIYNDIPIVLSNDDYSDDDENEYFIELDNYPTQLIFLEKLDTTLTEYLQIKKYDLNNWGSDELLSIFFQICFGLAVAQKYYYFVHNDLHASNIMFKKTNKTFLYFCCNKCYFKIPTFNKITKIIDFGRATFYYKKRFFVSDVFRKDGDAEGQVSYPYKVNNKNNNVPNRSFDLSLLSVTIKDFFTEEYLEKHKNINRLLKKWTTDKFGKNISDDNDNFDLYIDIARNMENAIPIEQFNDIAFKKFKINKRSIPKNSWIYYL